MNLRINNNRFGFISTYTNTQTAAFRLPTGDVATSQGRSVVVGPSQRAEKKEESSLCVTVGEQQTVHQPAHWDVEMWLIKVPYQNKKDIVLHLVL